ncbi:MAG: mechanosensitive ion channel family protein, partial [Gammaproteobacteria bacterium]
MEAELQQFQQIYVQVTTYLVEYSFQILGALIIVVLGYFVARRAGLMVEGFM